MCLNNKLVTCWVHLHFKICPKFQVSGCHAWEFHLYNGDFIALLVIFIFFSFFPGLKFWGSFIFFKLGCMFSKDILQLLFFFLHRFYCGNIELI